MRTTIQSNRRRRPAEWRRALVIVVLCLVLVIGGSFLNQTFGRAVLRVAAPFLRLGNAITSTIGEADSFLRSKQALLAENIKLKQRLIELEAALSDRELLVYDNELLREEVGLVQKAPELVSVAEVLSRPWNAPFDVILATASSPGVAVGNKVTFKENVWAGTVAEKAGATVKIKLLSAPDAQTPVLIGADNVPAQATGRGNGNLEAELPRSLDIKVGDLVISAEQSGLVVGAVGAVEKDPNESLQTVLIHTPINLSFIRYLEIHAN